MFAKHQFKYSYEEGCEDFSPLDVTFDIPGDATLQQMLYNFQSYLKACGFVFDGELEIVDHTFDVMKDELDGTLYEFDKDAKIDWDIAKLDKEAKEQREIRENVSKRADELKQMEERWKKISNEEKASILADVLKASGL